MNILRTTRLSELRALVKTYRYTDGHISPNMVRSIVQSLRVEGIVVTEADVGAAAIRVLDPATQCLVNILTEKDVGRSPIGDIYGLADDLVYDVRGDIVADPRSGVGSGMDEDDPTVPYSTTRTR